MQQIKVHQTKWFQALLSMGWSVIEAIVFRGILPEKIGRLNLIDTFIDMES